MRKIFLFMLVSVDGYFEAPDHDLSWHNVNAEFNEFANKQLEEEVGTLLFGRRTYDLMASFWPTSKSTTAGLMNALPKVVVSHSAFEPEWEHTTVISADASAYDDVASEIRKLKAQPGKDIAIFGSNTLCVSLMEAGLVDEFRIMTCPVALGKGTSLFVGLSKRTIFHLAKQHEFDSGNLLRYYSVKG
jgi:dihydrofolate reductase